MNTKKLRTTAIAVLLGLSVTGCGNSDNSSSEDNSSENTSSISEVSTGTSTTEAETEASQSNNNSNTELSDDLMDFQVSIDGNVLSFPCSVKELINAGCKIDESYTTKISAGKYNYMWFDCGEVKLYADVYNFSDKAYDLTEDTDSDDVIITDVTIFSSETGNSEVLLPKGIDFNDTTMNTFQETYGAPDIENGFGIVYYCGDHFNGDIVWNKSDSKLHHNDGDKKECNYYVEVCSVEGGTDPKLKYIRFASSEEIVESFYEKYPDQRK